MRIHIRECLVAAALLGGAVACDRNDHDDLAGTRADNTARNKLANDRDNAPVPTADQTSNSTDDLKLTQRIRQAVVGDDNLSTNAHNAKIIVENGVVTLAGPVKNADEKARLLDHASDAGASRVVDQLEVISETANR